MLLGISAFSILYFCSATFTLKKQLSQVGHPLRIRAPKWLEGKYFQSWKYLTVNGTLLKLPTEKQLSPGLTAPVRTWWRFMTLVYSPLVFLPPLSFLTTPSHSRWHSWETMGRMCSSLSVACNFTSVCLQARCKEEKREIKTVSIKPKAYYYYLLDIDSKIDTQQHEWRCQGNVNCFSCNVLCIQRIRCT